MQTEPVQRDLDALEPMVKDAWADGELLARAPEVAASLVRSLVDTTPLPTAQALLALGLLHEGRSADAELAEATRSAVAAGLDQYIAIASRASRQPDDRALRLALLYLLAHFPEHAVTLDPLVVRLDPGSDDAARVRRCLHPPTTDTLPEYEVGRAWPTPNIWQLPDDERTIDQQWRAQLHFSPTDLVEIARMETDAILAYLGAQAEFAIWEASHVN